MVVHLLGLLHEKVHEEKGQKKGRKREVERRDPPEPALQLGRAGHRVQKVGAYPEIFIKHVGEDAPASVTEQWVVIGVSGSFLCAVLFVDSSV